MLDGKAQKEVYAKWQGKYSAS